MCQGKALNAGRLVSVKKVLVSENLRILQHKISLVDLEAVDDEAKGGAEEASPGCETEELASTGERAPQAGGHADSTTEI